MRNSYTIKEVLNVYGSVIDDGVEKGFFKHRGEALTLINAMNYCGIDLYEYNKILFLMEKIKEIKSTKYEPNDEYYLLSKSDNIYIIYHLISEYFHDDKK